LHERGATLHLATVRGPVRDALERTGHLTTLREEGRIHEDVAAALHQLGLHDLAPGASITTSR
jgi:sulfate permease, SulP family